ncbi:McrC family protein [Flammeovirga sp. OC4]|uniref:McrC family protein n=1 Tax=Flammeovirga sp. OC4 TaxID=1382345 RepID=UPI0005C77564|nr:hypothetical protein [Flammeovirga sp. OC4]
MKNKAVFTVFEHQTLKVGDKVNDVIFLEKHLKALVKYYGNGLSYFDLVHKGVKFCHFVGVIKINDITIEILPKVDKGSEKAEWRKLLIDMLRVVGAFNIAAPSTSSLSLKNNFILDLYFELFLKEVEYLVHLGLIKQYRQQDSNQKVLKGKLQLSKHLRKNIVHKEQFFVNHTVYDVQHKVHQLLYKTLRLIYDTSSNPLIEGKVKQLLFYFPQMPDIKVRDTEFQRIIINRKLKNYEQALDIAQLLLLNYHPDLAKGENDVLALMFNMNDLWERFVCVTLQRKLKDYNVKGQVNKLFWKGQKNGQSYMRPDILLEHKSKNLRVVLDTKWKHIEKATPNSNDLRQLYAYSHFFNADKVALVYPGNIDLNSGYYQEGNKECAIIQIRCSSNINTFIESILTNLNCWLPKLNHQN